MLLLELRDSIKEGRVGRMLVTYKYKDGERTSKRAVTSEEQLEHRESLRQQIKALNDTRDFPCKPFNIVSAK